MLMLNEIPFRLWAELRRLPEADRICKESSQGEVSEPRNRGKGWNFTIRLLWNQPASSIGAMVSMPNRTAPPPPSPSNQTMKTAMKAKMKMTILNLSQMKVTWMMVLRMRQGSIASMNCSYLLRLFFLLDAEQGSEGRYVSIEEK